MSYARFGWEGSDVYVFATRGFAGDSAVIECCACRFGGTEHFATLAAIDDHLRLHEQAGHVVPDRVQMIAEIRRDGYVT